MLVGTGVFVTWVVTGWNWWERAWLWIIGFAIASVLAGAVCLTRDFGAQRKTGFTAPGGLVLAAALLVLNLPVGAFYLRSAAEIVTRYTVEVINDSGVPIQSVVISGPGVGRVELGSLGACATTQKVLRLTQDGQLKITAHQGGQDQSAVIDGSASPTCGACKTVVVGTGGICIVRRDSERSEFRPWPNPPSTPGHVHAD